MVSKKVHIGSDMDNVKQKYESIVSPSLLLFSEKMKLADLILANNHLLFVLSRFGIKLGFGEKTVREVCAEHDISASLFLVVCNVYAHDDFMPSFDALHTFDLSDLLVYLHNSHNDYLNVRIPAVKRKVMNVAESCGKKGSILMTFFDGYINEVYKHFEYEEKTVFPYIEKLLTEGPQRDFSIAVYEKNHTDIEDKLTELKNILIKYVPEVSLNDQREALLDLFQFEDDLDRHSLIENRIVVPMVLERENSGK